MELEEGESDATRLHLYHKEEPKARIGADATDRAGLRQKLETCNLISAHCQPSMMAASAITEPSWWTLTSFYYQENWQAY